MRGSWLILAGLNEYFSGFDNIGQNTPLRLIFLWIIPKYDTRYPRTARVVC